MQMTRRLVIGGRPLAPRSMHAHLALSTIGTAQLRLGPEALTPGPADREAIHALLSVAKGQLAECFLSVAGGSDYLILMGAVTQVTPGQGEYQVTIRELCAILDYPAALYFRHKSAREIVAEIELRSRLHFLVPSQARYLEERRPVFQSTGSFRSALEKVIQMWELPDTVWYQLPDGTMFFGPWRAGPFNKADVPVDERLVLEQNLNARTLRLPLIPALRPGMVVNCGSRFRIDALDFEDETMLIHWTRL
jgi:hypothetical protein